MKIFKATNLGSECYYFLINEETGKFLKLSLPECSYMAMDFYPIKITDWENREMGEEASRKDVVQAIRTAIGVMEIAMSNDRRNKETLLDLLEEVSPINSMFKRPGIELNQLK